MMSEIHEIMKPRLLQCIKSKVSNEDCSEAEFEARLTLLEKLTKDDSLSTSEFFYQTGLMEVCLMRYDGKWNLPKILRKRGAGAVCWCIESNDEQSSHLDEQRTSYDVLRSC